MRRLLAVLFVVIAAVAGAVSVNRVTRQIVEQELAERLPEAPNQASAKLTELAESRPRLLDGVLDQVLDGNGALRQLAIAAVGKNEAVALSAQQQIEDLLESGRPSNRTLRQRRRVAAALRSSGPGSAPGWTAAIASRLVRLVGQQDHPYPAEMTQGLLSDCEAVLAAAAATRRTTTTLAAANPPPRFNTPRLAATPRDDRTQQDKLATKSILNPPQRFGPIQEEFAQAPAATSRLPFEPRSFIAPESSESVRANPLAAAEPLAAAGAQGEGNLSWSPPPRLRESAPPVAAPVELPPAPPEPLELLTDRELLARFLPIAQQAAATPTAVGPTTARSPSPPPANNPTPSPTREDRLRQAVIKRGLGGVATRHVAMLLSPNEADRRRLVDLLLTTRSEGAARFLLMLAQDPSPTVRRSALRTLGSASDPRLVKAAWQMARDDEDPRVARLVNELRTR